MHTRPFLYRQTPNREFVVGFQWGDSWTACSFHGSLAEAQRSATRLNDSIEPCMLLIGRLEDRIGGLALELSNLNALYASLAARLDQANVPEAIR